MAISTTERATVLAKLYLVQPFYQKAEEVVLDGASLILSSR